VTGYCVVSSVKVMKYLHAWQVAMVAGPQMSVWISSPKLWAGGLILTLGIGWRVALANVQVSQSASCESGSNSTPTMAPLSTSFRAVNGALLLVFLGGAAFLCPVAHFATVVALALAVPLLPVVRCCHESDALMTHISSFRLSLDSTTLASGQMTRVGLDVTHHDSV
jgi:hypothetical protein